MGASTPIEWTDATWNPIRARLTEQGRARLMAEGRTAFGELIGDKYKMPGIGFHCEHVTEACRFCYAEAINLRLGTGLPFKPAHLDNGDIEIFLDHRTLVAPLRWKRPRRIFITSMTDAAARFVTDDMLDQMFAVMALTPWHTYQVLTKRPDRMRAYLEAIGKDYPEFGLFGWAERGGRLCEDGDGGFAQIMNAGWPLPNVWIGTSVHDQDSAGAAVPELMRTPAARRFLSIEPLLGPIDLESAWHGENALNSECWGECAWCEKGYPPLHNCKREVHEEERFFGRDGLDWIVVGGESGPNARPMHPDWIRSLRDQCKRADDVPFFFKQWGEWWEVDSDGRDEDGEHAVVEVGTREAEDLWDARDRLIAPDGQVFTSPSDIPEETKCRLMTRLGKRNAGRLLDGVEHNAFPDVHPQGR